MTDMLQITLKQTCHKDVARYFAVEGFNFCLFAGAEPDPGIDALLEKSRQIRAEGGIGLAIAMIYVAEFRLLHLTPTVVRVSLEDCPIDNRWATNFTEAVAAGKVL